MKRLKKILKWFFIILLSLLAGIYIFINTPFGQNWIVRQVTRKLSHNLKTKVSIKNVDFSLLNRMHLEGVLVEDRLGDTILYAGNVGVRITDWFIFKKNIQLKYVGLENAVLKIQRQGPEWRHQFLVDYFSSPSDSTHKKEEGISLDLKKAELKNVIIIKKDAWMGEDMNVGLEGLFLDADKMGFNGGRYKIKSLFINSPEVSFYKYRQLRPADPEPGEVAIESGNTTGSWNKEGISLLVDNLTVANGRFINEIQDGQPLLSYFDGNHVLLSGINATLNNFSLAGDTIISKLNLKAKERCGFEVKELVADARISPRGISLTNMNLETSKSKLRHYFSMSYQDLGDFNDFIHKVSLQAVFADSYVHSDDIAFFAPSLKKWNKKISISGKLRGKIDDFKGRDLVIQSGNNTFLDGDVTITGLPDIDKMFIDFQAKNFRTTYKDAVDIFPSISKITVPMLNKLDYINFRGNFTGFTRDFVTYGTIQTKLGTIVSDLNLKLPFKKDPVYSGNIETDNFNLGAILGDKNTGSLSVKASVKGKGFDTRTRNTLIDGTIKFVDYYGYRYKNIILKGKLEKKLFEGFAKMDDENAKFELNGTIDLNSSTPRFNMLANITEANLHALRITADSVMFSGKTYLDFSGHNIDDFLGTARVSEAEIMKGGVRLPFDSLVVTAGFSDSSQKKLSLSSNEFSANITGNYHLKELPDAFAIFLGKYFPSVIKTPRRISVNQHFDFDISTYYFDEYAKLIDKDLSGLNFCKLKGALNTTDQFLTLSGLIPQFKYKQFNCEGVAIGAAGNLEKLVMFGEARNIMLNDSLNIPKANFSISGRHDSSLVTIKAGVNQAVDNADINALVLTFSDGVQIEFDKSGFSLNGKQWIIEKDGKLMLRKNAPIAGKLSMKEGDQKIVLESARSRRGEWNDIKASLTNVNLGDISPFVLPRNRLEGLLTGDVLIEDPAGKSLVISGNISAEMLRLDNDSLGELKAVVRYENAGKKLDLNGTTGNKNNNLIFDGSISLDSTNAENNKVSLKAKRFEIHILERFLGSLFSDMHGYVTGDINLNGPINELAITGKGKLEEAGLKVVFTQCYYKIKDTDIELTPEEINLDGLILVDTVTKNPIYVKGGIEHSSFKHMLYNLEVSTKRPGTVDTAFNRPVLLLNTTSGDSKQFFGRVKGTMSLSVSGTDEDMYITIHAKASEKDSSYVTLPPSSSRESGMADFLVERKYGQEQNKPELTERVSNLVYDVTVTANPAVTVRMILDELTGDEIKGKGHGTLNIHSGTAEPLTLRGRFDIDEGDYLFTFQSFFKKPFVLEKNGKNFISWDGDPFGAKINVTAVYTANKVNLTPLASMLGNDNNSLQGQREDVHVLVKLTDSLFKPNYSFNLKFLENSRVNSDPSLTLGLQQLEANENEINKQVAYLIVLNSFAPTTSQSTTTGGMGNTINELAYSTFSSISGLLFNEISKVVNDAFAKVSGNRVGFNISGSVYNRNLLEQKGSSLIPNQSQLDINIPIYISDRFYVKLGSHLDLALQNSTGVQENLKFLPDVMLEWLINESGSLRASLFYQQNIDPLNSTALGQNGKSTRYGGNVSLRRDANKIGDLFNIFRKKRRVGGNTAAPSPH